MQLDYPEFAASSIALADVASLSVATPVHTYQQLLRNPERLWLSGSLPRSAHSVHNSDIASARADRSD